MCHMTRSSIDRLRYRRRSPSRHTARKWRRPPPEPDAYTGGPSVLRARHRLRCHRDAGVAQLAERQPSKLHVAGSIPVSRSTPPRGRPCRSMRASILREKSGQLRANGRRRVVLAEFREPASTSRTPRCRSSVAGGNSSRPRRGGRVHANLPGYFEGRSGAPTRARRLRRNRHTGWAQSTTARPGSG